MRSLRRGILATTALLVMVGVIMIYSTSAIYARETYQDPTYFLKRHLIYLAVGVALFLWVLGLPSQEIRRWAKPLMGLSLLFLLVVLVPHVGHKVSGARRWFKLAWLSFQPSALAQLAIVLYLSDLLHRKRAQMENLLHGLLPALIVLGFTVLLILAEPDLGTAVAISTIALVLLFVGGAHLRMLVPLLVGAVPAVIVLIFSRPYRVRRILAFLNPWADPEGAGFQLIQSLVALGSGGLFGVGLGESRQKLFYLPAAHTDFIFSVIGEELGFIGATVVLLIMIAFIWYGIRLALRAPDSFGVLTGIGIVLLMALEALVHVGVTLGAIPTKGLPFPFISYGGTALIMNLVSVAVLLNVTRPQPSPALEGLR